MRNLVKLSAIFFLALLTLSVSSIYAEKKAVVHLLDKAEVTAPDATLGEIATIVGDGELAEVLKKIHISESPKVGQKASVSAYRIRSMLHREGFDNVEIKGLQSTYTTESCALSPRDLQAQATEWIQSQLPSGTEAELSFTGIYKDWLIPSGDDVTIEFGINGNRLLRSTSLYAEAKVQGRTFSVVRFRSSMRLFREVAVLSKPVKHHETLTRDCISLERSDVTNLRGMEIASVDEVIGMMTSSSFPARHILTLHDLEKPVLIEKGAMTKILIRNGSISMTIAGAVAMHSGREGELVRFKNPMNPRTMLQARVVDRGLAHIIIR